MLNVQTIHVWGQGYGLQTRALGVVGSDFEVLCGERIDVFFCCWRSDAKY